MMEFEWDSTKARINLQKHGISFEEAQSVFYDEYAVQFDDDGAAEEERFIMLGISIKSKILVVCHCERPDGRIIRIISARKATANERTFYQGPSL